MTLIATALSDESVVQVVDRRLTRDGVLYDDLANKGICGVCADARFSVAYTGLMMTPNRTDEWLVDFLSDAGVLQLSLLDVLKSLAGALTQEFVRFRNLPENSRRLTLAFAGFGSFGPFAATVSNQEDDQERVLSKPEDQFQYFICLRNDNVIRRLDFAFYGAEAAINDELTKVIMKLRRALFRQSGDRIASAMVAVVRRAAKHSQYGHLISPNCISVVHNRDSAEMICDDHFQGHRRKIHLPHFVSSTQTFKHISIQPG